MWATPPALNAPNTVTKLALTSLAAPAPHLPPPRSEFLVEGCWVAKGLVGRISLIVKGWVWAGEYRNVALLVPGLLEGWGTC